MIDFEPIICPECGGTGFHPWRNASCKVCNGTGELLESFDDRYRIVETTRNRASSGCLDNRLFV